MTDNNKPKLELSWVGKNNPDYDIANIEPRILEEDATLSNCANDPHTENMIIHGDNMLALKALLAEYENKVKCIYIDPPYNTQSAFELYDDNVEHSTWLSLMKPRLEILRMLLKEDGFIFVNIDDNEMAYLSIIMDEIFGRKNRFDQIAIKTSSSQGGFGGVNPGLISNTEYILIYTKNRDKSFFNENNLFVEKDYDENYTWIVENFLDEPSQWSFKNLNEIVYEELNIPMPYNNQTWRKMKELYGESWQKIRYEKKALIALQKPNKVFRTFNPNKPAKYLSDALTVSKLNRNTIIIAKSENSNDEKLCLNGEIVLFYSKMMKEIDNKLVPVKFLTTFWDDFSWEGISSEGSVLLRNGKKPEGLIKRILDISCNVNDIVLDSFLGSGTTAAVAHKMGRKYIGIEMGDHAYTHCKVRLDAVINGTDQSGISKAVEWKGGGAYKFYELAPSFIVTDEFGNPVIDTFYNDAKLIKAMCKLLNFSYAPSKTEYWKHGVGQGKNFLYVTTQLLSCAMIQQIAAYLAAGETLIICPKKYEPGADKIDSRITVKKIPKSVLKACHFGKKEYLLPIKETAIEEFEDEMDDNE